MIIFLVILRRRGHEILLKRRSQVLIPKAIRPDTFKYLIKALPKTPVITALIIIINGKVNLRCHIAVSPYLSLGIPDIESSFPEIDHLGLDLPSLRVNFNHDVIRFYVSV